MGKGHTSGGGHARDWIVPVVAIAAMGLLAQEFMQSSFQEMGRGTVALLTIGLLALFVALYHDREGYSGDFVEVQSNNS